MTEHANAPRPTLGDTARKLMDNAVASAHEAMVIINTGAQGSIRAADSLPHLSAGIESIAAARRVFGEAPE